MRNTVRSLTFIYPQSQKSPWSINHSQQTHSFTLRTTWCNQDTNCIFLGAQRTPGLGPWSCEATTLLVHHKTVFFFFLTECFRAKAFSPRKQMVYVKLTVIVLVLQWPTLRFCSCPLSYNRTLFNVTVISIQQGSGRCLHLKKKIWPMQNTAIKRN